MLYRYSTGMHCSSLIDRLIDDDDNDDCDDDDDDDDMLCMFFFSEGRNSMVVDVYEQFYQNNHINHWSSPPTWFPIDSTSVLPSSLALTSSPTITAGNPSITTNSIEAISYEMDLHEFSRGMAYAAIKVALREVRS